MEQLLVEPKLVRHLEKNKDLDHIICSQGIPTKNYGEQFAVQNSQLRQQNFSVKLSIKSISMQNGTKQATTKKELGLQRREVWNTQYLEEMLLVKEMKVNLVNAKMDIMLDAIIQKMLLFNVHQHHGLKRIKN